MNKLSKIYLNEIIRKVVLFSFETMSHPRCWYTIEKYKICKFYKMRIKLKDNRYISHELNFYFHILRY